MNISKLKWALLWALLIFILCLLPGKTLPQHSLFDFLALDKWVHLLLFFMLYFLSIRSFHPEKQNNTIVKFILIVIGSCYGALLEYFQGTFLVDRSPELFDWIADTAGSLLGPLFFSTANKLFTKIFN